MIYLKLIDRSIQADERYELMTGGEYRPDWAGIDDAVRRAGLDSPVLALDLDALDHNIADLRRRAAGRPIRVASKSLRVRSMIEKVLAEDGYAGVLAYDVAEAHWLATQSGVADVLLGYPTCRREALTALLADDLACRRVTLLVDDEAQLDLIDSVVTRTGARPSASPSTSTPPCASRAAACTWGCAAPRSTPSPRRRRSRASSSPGPASISSA